MARRNVQNIFGNVGTPDKNMSISRAPIQHAPRVNERPNPYTQAGIDMGKTYAMKNAKPLASKAMGIFGGGAGAAAGSSGAGVTAGGLQASGMGLGAGAGGASVGSSASLLGGSSAAGAGSSASLMGGTGAAGAGGGSLMSGAAAAGPVGWIVAAAVGNELYARKKGYRAKDNKEYAKDLFTSEVFNQDLEQRWLPKVGIKEGSTANKVISHISNPFGWFASKL